MKNPYLFQEKRSLKEISAALMRKLGVNYPVNRIDDDTFAIICSFRSQLVALATHYNLNIIEENQKLLTIEAVVKLTDQTYLKI